MTATCSSCGKVVDIKNSEVSTDSGIYMYYFNENRLDNYIGHTASFKRRHEVHMSALKLLKHHSKALQAAYNKYEKVNMYYEQLETMKFPENYSKKLIRGYLESRENYYQTMYNSKYSTLKGGESIFHTWGKKQLGSSVVYQVDKNLNIIEKFNSIRSAAKKLNVDHTSIHKVATLQIKHTGGLYFRLLETLSIPFEKIPANKIAVDCYDLSGKFVITYNGIREAANNLGLQSAGITRCCKGILRYCGNYIFRYSNSSIVVIPINTRIDGKSKKVLAFKNREYIGEFNSFKSASDNLHVSRSRIKRDCENILPLRYINQSPFNFKYA